MGEFSASWLSLREPADHAARSHRLADTIAGAVRHARDLAVLDLGSGTGSNLRYLSPRLLQPQRWLLVDRDAGLLAEADARRPPTALSIETRQLDLGHLDEIAIASIFEGCQLVTASALLDLVSEGWVERIADRCAGVGAAALFALTYDGRIECAPRDSDDEMIRRLVNEHQRRDKGFGPALGPAATDAAARAFASHGYRIERDRSDWVLATAAVEIQRELIDGLARATAEVAPHDSPAIDAWRARRLAHVMDCRSQIVVGHEDLAATFR